ncbi:MAG: sugar ABC transporter ATP-binding protein [Eubacteriales bacterium]|jgi:ribose transport system ATP-binding protein|nr:sugar ABC transporter ATP-binding protein [Eubacteriales bacterium]
MTVNLTEKQEHHQKQLPLLELRGICASVSEFFSLKDIEFSIMPGEVHMIMGENGSGKSSLINVIAGNLMPDRGDILINGEVVYINNPAKAKELGIATTYQYANSFNNLTVAENIYLDHLPLSGRFFKSVDWMRLFRDADILLKQLGFNLDSRLPVRRLNIAERQLIEIAKAYVSDAKILVLDEPTATLTEREVNLLFNIIREFKKKGSAILYISHRVNEIRKIGDRLTILRDGRIIVTDHVDKFHSQDIVGHMSGLSFRERYPKLKIQAGEEVMRVENLSFKTVLDNINFTLRKREILGITGLVGSGRTMIAKCIFGAMKPDSLRLYLHGEKEQVHINSPAEAINKGLGYVCEDRYIEGLFSDLNLPVNITTPDFVLEQSRAVINKDRENAITQKYVNKLIIKANSIFDRVRELSGGNQQKVLLSKWIYSRSDILILDEPTRGIDVPSKVDLYNIINEMLRQDVSVLFISSDIDEMVGMCDRILVLYGGGIAAEIPHAEATREKIMYYATGNYLLDD